MFSLRGFAGGVGRAAQFAVNLVGVAVAAQFGQERVGVFGHGDGFGGKEGGQAALPVLVLAFDLAFGLRRAGVTQRYAIEVKRGTQLREGFGVLREEEAVTVHIKFQRQAMFAKGGGQEIKISQEVFTVIDFGPGADARAIIEQIQQRIVLLVGREPAMGCGVQLPERAGLEALPAAQRSRSARNWKGMSQLLFDGPSADGGRVNFKIETAMDFGGGKAIRGWGFGGKEFAQEGFDACGPMRGVIAAGNAGRPGILPVVGDGAKVIGVEQIEAGAAQFEGLRGSAGRGLAIAEGSQDFADQRRAEAMGELAIMFFIAPRMRESREKDERGALALRAFRRPPLRSGLLQARRANGVHLCSHTVHV